MKHADCPACCQLPPIEADYTPKGSYADFEGLKTYTSGLEDAKSAVLMVYDVFGFSPQIVQGAFHFCHVYASTGRCLG